MVVNPFDRKVNLLKEELEGFVRKKDGLAKDCRWFEGASLARMEGELDLLAKKSFELGKKREAVDGRVRFNREELAGLPVLNKFNPLNWWSAESKLIRSEKLRLNEAFGRLNDEKEELIKQDRSLEAGRVHVSGLMKKYRGFDLGRTRSQIASLEEQIKDKDGELRKARRVMERIDHHIRRPSAELGKYQAELAKFEWELEKAKGYERRLNRAANSYERAKIHEECEMELGSGQPRSIISRSERNMAKTQRAIVKTEDRIRSLIRRHSREMESIIIDGSNLCYAGRSFISLGILEGLVQKIKDDFKVMVFFDAGIHGKLQMSTDEIKNKLSGVEVNFATRNHEADESIVKLASHNPTCFILSGDRFTDYGEYSVIKDERLIKPEIIGSQLLIHDLGIDLSFEGRD